MRDVTTARENFDYLLADISEARKALASKPDLIDILRIRDRVMLGSVGRLQDIALALDNVVSRHRVEADQLARLDRDKQEMLKLVGLCGFVLTILSTSIIVISFSHQVSNRLSLIRDNFAKFKHNLRLNPPLKGRDEICDLDHHFRVLAGELAEASAKDKAIFINMPAGLIVCNQDGHIESVNPCGERMLFLDQFHYQGSNIMDFLVEGTPDCVTVKSAALLPPGRYYFRIPGAANIPVELTPSVYEIGSVKKLLFAFVDLSEKEQIEQMKQEFVSIVSHDLQTPLTSVAICLALLKDAALPQATGELVSVADMQVKRLMRLTTDLLDLAKAEAGKLVIHKEVVAVSAIMEQSIGAVAALGAERNIEIIDCTRDLDIEVDADKVCQILTNFLSNAIKYSQPNTRVTITMDKENGWLRFAVTDQGKGIPAAEVGSVFEKFRQVSRSDSQHGTGLGLAICRLLAETHGGQVGVESQVGVGSTFWLLLPDAPAGTV